MPKTKTDNRIKLIEAAVEVTYRHGFGEASLADIAKEARVPLGNIYYYFKTKDEIGEAIIDRRVSRFRKLLMQLDKADSPKERLCAFVQIKIKNRHGLARNGCPVGTLCSELQKHGGAVAEKSRVLFVEALVWMESQFKALGRGADARELAVHLLAATQGASVLAHTFHDPSIVAMEAVRLKQWIRAL
jgi:AcrR family transcriptional regulator